MDWEKQYRDACKSIDSLTAELERVKARCEGLQNQVADFNLECEALEIKNQWVKAEKQRLEHEKTELVEAKDRVINSNVLLRNETRRLRDEISDLEKHYHKEAIPETIVKE